MHTLTLHLSPALSSQAGLVEKANYEGFVNIRGFQAFCKTRQMFLSPVFIVQKGLQQATLGVTGWENVAKRNIEVHFGRSLTVRELLSLVSTLFFATYTSLFSLL